MNLFRITSAVFCASVIAAAPAMAQKKPLSPPATATATISGDAISIAYSQPYIRDPKTGTPRKIWGGLVPYGKVWRTGANEATVLSTDKDLVFGSTTIPAGKYSLWTIPQEDGSAVLVFNKQTGEWGTKHDESQDFARVPLARESLGNTVDPFTIEITSSGGANGMLKLSWEKTAYAAEFRVKS